MPFEQDSLYGITHVAEKWQGDGTLKKIKAFLLADMIGDADLDIDRDPNSTPWLEDVVGEAAKRLGYQSHFFARNNTVGDDHVPFMKRGVPVRRPDRFFLRLQQCLLAHHAGYGRQTQPQESGHRGQRDAGDRAHSRQDGSAAAEVEASQKL